MKKIFIDGQEGTTGLQIFDRLKDRDDIQLLEIPHEKRKDADTKKEFLNQANLVILCLPDGPSKESVGLIKNPETKVIDASTAHRTSVGWTYGLPELNANHRDKIRESKRVANPGCYPTGFILTLYPLVHKNIVPVDYPAIIHAVSGYSGGGKKLINLYENQENKGRDYFSYRPYALGTKHKHVNEMQEITGLKHAPFFSPAVGNFYEGMLINVPLVSRLLNKKVEAKEIRDILYEYYASEPFVKVMEFEKTDFLDNGFLSPTECKGTNRVELFVFDHADQILLISRLDNLGKGASGAAVQNMNIMLGFDERKGLIE